MKFKGAKINELGRLSALCKDDLATNTKIGLLSFQEGKTHPVFETLILFVEYFQLVSQALLTRKNSTTETGTDSSISDGVIFVAKVFNPGYWLTFDSESDLVFGVLTVVMIYTLAKFLLFGNIILIAYKNIPHNAFLVGLWKWNFNLQGRVTCFIVSSIWLGAVLASLESDFDIFGIGQAGSLGLFITLLLIEYFFSFFLSMRYCMIVPNKSLLSSKGYHTEAITLSQKFVTQIIQILFAAYSINSNVVYTLVNILFSTFRTTHYFVTFPLYNMKVLLYQAFLLMVVNSLDFSCLLQIITNSLDSLDDVEFIAIVWIILTVLTTKVAYEYLLKIRISLIAGNSKVSPSLLVHKIIAIKQLRKQKKIPGEFHDNCEYGYLLNIAVDAGLDSVFNFDFRNLKTQNPTLTSKESANELFANYLEELLLKFPKNNFIKLYMAEFYAKKLKLYGIAMKLLTGLQNSHNSVASLNASILIWEIQSLIRTKGSMDEKQINLYIFFKTQMRYVELKKKMHRQNEAQIELYEELLGESPDLMKVFNDGQIVTQYRVNVEREMNQMIADMPDYYVQPLLHCAHYHSISNNSLINYAKYFKLYTIKSHKYEKYFEIDSLKPENYYQDGNAFALISGQKDDFGKIIFCTNSVSKILGGDVNMYIGANISTLAPLSSQSFYSLYFENKSVGEQSELRGGVFRGFSSHKEGYVVEIDYHLDVFPFMTQGFYFSLIMRPTRTQKEYIILCENGDIEGATRRVANQLRLKRPQNSTVALPSINIKHISEELTHINHAFNIIAHSEHLHENEVKKTVKPGPEEEDKDFGIKFLCKSPGKKREGQQMSPREEHHIDHALAQKLYSTFTQNGKDIPLLPVSLKELRIFNSANAEEESKHWTYNCRMKLIPQASEVMKLIILDENKRANASSKFLTSKAGMASKMENEFIKPSFDVLNTQDAKNLFKKSSTMRSNKSEGKAKLSEKLSEKLSDTRSENFGDMALEEEDDKPVENEFGFSGPRKHYQPKAFFPMQEDTKILKSAECDLTEGGLLLSPIVSANPRASLLHGGGNLLTPDEPEGPTITIDVTKQKIVNYGSNSTESYREKDEEDDKEENVEKLYDDVTSMASQKSRFSERKHVARAFNSALTSKYYSRTLRWLFIFCYLFLIGVLIGQINLKTSVDSTTSSLQTKKNLLRNSQKRDFQLVGIYRTSRFVWDLGTGGLKSSMLGAFASPISTYQTVTMTSIVAEAAMNQDVLKNAGNLDDSTREQLFLEDVRIFYNYNGSKTSQTYYVNQTNFQAANIIVEAALNAIACSKTGKNLTIYCKVGFDFLFKNCLNDLLLKSESVSNLVLESIKTEIQDKRTVIDYLLAVRLILLFIIGFSLTWIITKQYLKEKVRLLALTKLDPQGIQEALDTLNIFKTSLETGDNIEGKTHKKIIKSAKKSYKSQIGKKNKAKKNVQSPDHRGILRRYLAFIIKSLICILILSGFAIWSSISASNSIQFLKSQQSMLYFADAMATRTNYAFLTSQEVFATNNTSTLRNEPVLEQLQYSIEDVNSLKNSVMDVFLEPGTNPDPQVQTILLDDGCQFLGSGSARYCTFIQSTTRKTNLISMLSDYESFIREKYQKFLISNGTESSLRAYQTDGYPLMLSLQRTIADQSTYIADRINTIFDTKFENVTVQVNIAFSVFVVALVAISYLLWVLVFKELREGINKFKNILQVFPSNLILANFVLKNFLVQTSMGVLDSVKNNM